jgi:AraC family transcriptional regulator
LERAAELICRGQLKITDVALEVGFASPSHFTTAFREVFGCCPGLYPLRLVRPNGLERRFD